MTVTEAEWLECTNPERMLEFIQKRASERKLRLFVVGCSRFVWEQMIDEEWRVQIHKAELYADGLLDIDRFHERDDYIWRRDSERRYAGKRTPEGGIPPEVQAWGLFCCTGFYRPALHNLSGMTAWRFAIPLVRPYQAILLHDIFGSLSFCPVTICPAILAWNDMLVLRIAQAAYDERHLPAGTLDNGRLTVLADALEEAGCTDADILGHLRGPGPHVRGCWAVDLCLGKS